MMNSILLMMILLVAMGSVTATEKQQLAIIELPRPNSGTFTFEQAEARKSEILSNTPSPKLEHWKNPFMGFGIHIHKDDRITVYQDPMEAFRPRQTVDTKRSVAEIKQLTVVLPIDSSPAGILITSDLPLKDSKVIHELLKVLFVPSIQLYYARISEPKK